MNPYTLAAYYFPNYHVDPRNEKEHGSGWTEWDLLRGGTPRFPGHDQPKVPVWGYEDESDPIVMARKISAAKSHGLNAFIFDWYWYNDGPFLNRALDKGFLAAASDGKFKFGLMWANHDYVEIFPLKYSGDFHHENHRLYPGVFTPETWEKATDYMAEHYFQHPACWKIDGCPYFSIYEIEKFIRSFGSTEAARKALERLDSKAKAVGCEGIHGNMIHFRIPVLPGEVSERDPNLLSRELGCKSLTSYVWVHHRWPTGFPTTNYPEYAAAACQDWQKTTEMFALPYYPHVSMGWDPSPRVCATDKYENKGYPFSPILVGNTPEEFQLVLEKARQFLDTLPPHQRILTINAWNEWTEGSYLEPDTVHGMAYLEAIRNTFPPLPAESPRILKRRA